MAGKDSGERLWPFPMDPDFDTALKSSVADVLQCTVSSEADHILAAVFLKKFVHKDINWVHLDLSPAAKSGAKSFAALHLLLPNILSHTVMTIKTGKTVFKPCVHVRVRVRGRWPSRRTRACHDRGNGIRCSCHHVSRS